MQRVFDGDITHEDITRMDYHPHRAYAAIAWLLLHPEGRLDDNLYVLGSFRKVLSEVTGRDESGAADYTSWAEITTSDTPKKHGVPSVVVATARPTCRGDYHMILRRTVRLTPPQGLVIPRVRVGDPIFAQLVETIGTARGKEAIELACMRLDAYLG